MPDDPLLARADAAISASRSLHVDRRALREDLDVSRSLLRDQVLANSILSKESKVLRKLMQDLETAARSKTLFQTDALPYQERSLYVPAHSIPADPADSPTSNS